MNPDHRCADGCRPLDDISICPWSIPCPVPGCGAGPGTVCNRPSGHNRWTAGSALHADRIAEAEEADVRNGAAWTLDPEAVAWARANRTSMGWAEHRAKIDARPPTLF